MCVCLMLLISTKRFEYISSSIIQWRASLFFVNIAAVAAVATIAAVRGVIFVFVDVD